MALLPSRKSYRIARRKVGGLALGAVGPLALRKLARTWSCEERGEPPRGAGLICLWHGRMLVGLEHYAARGWSVLVSPSDDGELSQRMLASAGYRVVRGSTSRGGARALREMLAGLEAGSAVILTPDGPRGPRHAMNPGVAWMARASGLPVHPLGVACDAAWRLASWDAFTIPKPRARVVFVWAEPLTVARGGGEDALARATEAIRARLLAAERAACSRLGVEPDW
jgi:lysophospholipid acyltransferase (LPLAT)-like uncharacterized protein